MTQSKAMMSLRVPGKKEFALVIRTALSGAAVLMDLDMDTLDDLRTAADEACDCLIHQSRKVREVEVKVYEGESTMLVTLEADFEDAGEGAGAPEIEITRAVLETLAAQADVVCEPCGLVRRIDLTMARAA